MIRLPFMTDRGLEPGCPHFTPYLSLAVTSTWDIYWDSIICPLANISGNFTITNFRGDAEFGTLTLQSRTILYSPYLHIKGRLEEFVLRQKF